MIKVHFEKMQIHVDTLILLSARYWQKKCKWKLNESFICSGGQGLGGKIVHFNERKGKSWGWAKCSSTEGRILSIIYFM